MSYFSIIKVEADLHYTTGEMPIASYFFFLSLVIKNRVIDGRI